MTRRELVQCAAGLVGVSLARRVLHAQEYRMAGADLKLGVASYSFRKFSREQTIQMMKQLGTPFLNVKEFHLSLASTPEQIEAARQEFDKAGIILVGCGNVSFSKDDEADMRHKFEYAKRAGFPLIVCAPTHTTLPKLEKFVKEFDIKIAVHNHGPEDKNFPTPQSVLEAVKNMDARCGLCMDIGHSARTGVNLVESVDEAGPRLLDMHVKDLSDPSAKDTQVPVGEGKLPIPQIFHQLVKMRYSGSVNLEYEADEMNPLPGMQRSFTYMRHVLAAIEAEQQGSSAHS